MSLGKIFGTGSVNFRPSGIKAGGLSGKKGKLTRTAERSGALAGLSSTFGEAGQAFGELRQRITPGLNASARLRELENARLRTTGNLRENLQRRRALGSSFATDALARADADFATKADRIRADAARDEAEVAGGLIAQEFQAKASQFGSLLKNMNFEAGLAANITNATNQIMAQNARQTAAALHANTSSASGFGARMFGLGV